MTTANALVIDAVRAGVLLIADGARLRYKSLGRIPPDLARQIKAQRDDVLALLRGAEADAPAPETDGGNAPHRMSADLSAILRNAFEPWKLEPVRIELGARYQASNPRRQAVIDLLLPVLRATPDRAVALRDAWAERIAICRVDGGLSVEDAEALALNELKSSIANWQ